MSKDKIIEISRKRLPQKRITMWMPAWLKIKDFSAPHPFEKNTIVDYKTWEELKKD